jgi:hypothetical protein
LSQQSKAKKVGRPKLPKGEAKGRIVPVRLDADDLKLVTAAARANRQVVSEWIRNALRTAAEVSMFKHTLHDAMRMVLLEQPDYTASTSTISDAIEKKGLYERKDGLAARAGQISARARKYPHMFAVVEPGKIRLLRNSVATGETGLGA